jgi:hypothetical protein
MPKINIDKILKSLTHNTAVYVYSIAVTGKSIVNELQLCYRETMGDKVNAIVYLPVNQNLEKKYNIINGTPNAPLDATIFEKVPTEITHIIGRDRELLPTVKLGNGGNKQPAVGIMGGGRNH